VTIWAFFDNHWFLAFLAICFSYGMAVRLIRLPILLLHGWPAPPMDADGDVNYPKMASKVEQTEAEAV
jgi:hypothetical protein